MKKRLYATAALPPPGMRGRITQAQRDSLTLISGTIVDAIARETATLANLNDWAHNSIVWSKVAQLIDGGHAEMSAVMHLAAELVNRYQATGRIHFATDEELALARSSVGWEQDLVDLADPYTLHKAGVWAKVFLDRKSNPTGCTQKARALADTAMQDALLIPPQTFQPLTGRAARRAMERAAQKQHKGARQCK